MYDIIWENISKCSDYLDSEMNLKVYFHLLVLLYLLAIAVAITQATRDGGILILPMPAFSAMYKSACFARELKEHGHNVTVVLPDGRAKKTLLEEFGFDYIVSEGMTKTLGIMDEFANESYTKCIYWVENGIDEIDEIWTSVLLHW